MKNYYCKYKDKNGEIVSEIVQAESIESLMAEAKQEERFLINVRNVGKLESSLRDALSKDKLGSSLGGKIDKKTISILMNQIAFMREAGLPMHRSIETLRQFTSNRALKKSLEQIGKSINQGSKFNQALYEQMHIYGPSVVYQVRAGEQSGDTENTLKAIANNLDKEVAFRNKVKTALTYPTMIVITTIVIVYFLMTKVVPSMTSAITSMGAELPLITKVVMFASEIISKFGGYVIGAVVVMAVTFVYTYKNSIKFKYTVDYTLLKIPYVGSLITRLKLTHFCRLLSSLQKSGVNMIQSLDIVKDAVGNAYVTHSIEKIAKLVEIDGRSLSSAMAEYEIFPEVLVQLIHVGSASGTLGEVLEMTANNFEEEVDESLKKVLAYVDTLLILFIGAIVGLVVVSMFLPMFGFINQL